jgi:hypothetical protein
MEESLNALESLQAQLTEPHLLSVANEQSLDKVRGTLQLSVILGRITFHQLGGSAHIQSWATWLKYNDVQLAGIDEEFVEAMQ